MATYTHNDQTFEVDEKGFLVDWKSWTKGFAEGKAPQLHISVGLTTEHWEVIDFIRCTYDQTGKCPTVYETCRMKNLRLKDLRRLFPTGYLRGACLMAGITYRESRVDFAYSQKTADDLNTISSNKTYETDVRGFLVYPDEWDKYYAAFRAHDMKIPGGRLTDEHWRIIHYLRDAWEKTHNVPSVYETCEANGIELDELERLFPDGYHRGAVKIAGLRVR